MKNGTQTEYSITIDQLQPGVFIRLDETNWFDHPFLFSSFKVKNEEQIRLIKSLGATHIICVPEKSDVLPLPPSPEPVNPPEDPGVSQEVIDHLWTIKRERVERLRRKREHIAQCEERFTLCIKTFDTILKNILGGQLDTYAEAVAFVERMADFFLGDRESTLHLMNIMDKGQSAYSHPMNVAVLSMMVGKEAGLSREEMTTLGLGALFHDIGELRVEKKILKKRGELTRPEREIYEQHPALGATILTDLKLFPDEAVTIAAQHHERMDGSGFPAALSSEQISRLARIVAVTDAYDKHCNHADPMESLTPYLALSYMFGQQKHLFDVEVLTLFIRCLGVYPPGTIVELSNGSIGMVMAVNPVNQLCPSVVLYDPDVPKKEALIVELAEEPDLRVEKSIRLAQLSKEVHDYLSPRARITYYIDPS